MIAESKPVVYWCEFHMRWDWHCPSSHCQAQTYESHGYSKIWELAHLAAYEHAREHHRRKQVSHDL